MLAELEHIVNYILRLSKLNSKRSSGLLVATGIHLEKSTTCTLYIQPVVMFNLQTHYRLSYYNIFVTQYIKENKISFSQHILCRLHSTNNIIVNSHQFSSDTLL